ncbi:2-succinyl-5-enolpyruvyl-6-hydroxy-3-cyclohexene-1-carboxylic-acid synthase [Vibrio sp.]|uniref:2-succinyl-5-enolpyruvyl-6-hydroxy-3- cyclohexene-1-carboxylic-acid synthase n=1 Tax=Vibrio sp. TaxID=678 RepID=UPI003D1357A6
MSEQALLNRLWSATLLEELSRYGVKDVCIAPGSRSTPLTLAADANPAFRLHTHFDERGLGFLALGLAKASRQPVAVIVTSGTAVANLLPAVAEAALTGERIVLLTADRPVELIDCGANQAIDQLGIFSSHVAASLPLPSPSRAVSLNWLLTSLDQTLQQQQLSGGAVHINCPFPEPLYGADNPEILNDYTSSVAHWRAGNSCYSQLIDSQVTITPDWQQLCQRKGLVVIGNLPVPEAQTARQWAEQLGWPVLCDPQSGISSDWAHYDIWLQHSASRQVLSDCESVVQFGGRLVSKRLNQWLKQHIGHSGCDYLLVTPQRKRLNQDHLMQQHYLLTAQQWLEAFNRESEQWAALQSGWADRLGEMATRVTELCSERLNQRDMLSELSLATSLPQLHQARQLFIGNSLFVRLVDMFGKPDERPVYTNRGASGIDGLVASFAGVSRAEPKPGILFIGDTSLLYDLNSLALLMNSDVPLVVVVVNNDGGAIFNLLPVPEAQKQALYQMPHGLQFKHAAQQFGLGYVHPATLEEYLTTVNQHLEHGSGTLLVEVTTPPEQASQDIQQLVQRLNAV